VESGASMFDGAETDVWRQQRAVHGRQAGQEGHGKHEEDRRGTLPYLLP
jgi:hypothetical protein